MASNGAREGIAARAQSAAVATTPPKGMTLAQKIEAQQSEVERALPTHLKANAAAYTRALITVIKQTPNLAKCDPLTILGGLMTASQLGLEYGPLGHCYLVPFKNHGRDEAQFQLGYKGAIDLAFRSGKLASISARTVREGDDFDFDYGLLDSLHHKPNIRGEQGEAYAWYGVAKFRDGGHHFVVLSRADVNRHRAASKSAGSERSPWNTNYDQMAQKSCVHEMKSYLPLTTEVHRALALDDVVARGTSIDNLVTEQVDYIDAEAVEETQGDLETGEIIEAGSPEDERPFDE
jgi:recombination protein RecT